MLVLVQYHYAADGVMTLVQPMVALATAQGTFPRWNRHFHPVCAVTMRRLAGVGFRRWGWYPAVVIIIAKLVYSSCKELPR
eukprot:SAG11_NODE_3244_length_2585_cov_1.163315_3_plen_81_part_00